MASCARFLCPSQPRVRVLGGTRFDPLQTPAAEWEQFGSFCFLLPQVELTESDQVLLLAVNIAWDGRYSLSEGSTAAAAVAAAAGSNGVAAAEAVAGTGPSTAAAAVAAALAALAELQPPKPATAPAHPTTAVAPEHQPDVEGWGKAIEGALQQLGGDPNLKYPSFGLANMDVEMAKNEFMTAGQQVRVGVRVGWRGWGQESWVMEGGDGIDWREGVGMWRVRGWLEVGPWRRVGCGQE